LELVDDAEEPRVSDDMYVILVCAKILVSFTTPDLREIKQTTHRMVVRGRPVPFMAVTHDASLRQSASGRETKVCSQKQRTCLP